MIQTIGIIGSGNVAWHMAHAFKETQQVDLCWIFARNNHTLTTLHRSLNVPCFTQLPQQSVDLIVICVQDDELQACIDQLPRDSKIAYTAASVALEELSVAQKYCGVFYPLQTFSTQRTINFSEVPLLIESKDAVFQQELMELAQKLTKTVVAVNSQQRKHMHLAAVFANNFVNHLLWCAQDYLKKHDLDPQMIHALIRETVEKALELGTFKGQSGPARRNDQKTIQKHINMLDDHLREIYIAITNNILNTYFSQKKQNHDHV